MQDILLHLEHLCAVRVKLGNSRRLQGHHSVPHAQLDRMDPAQHLRHAPCAILSVVFHNTPLQMETLHAPTVPPALGALRLVLALSLPAQLARRARQL